MKCWIQFSRKNKKNITNYSPAESAHSVLSVKMLVCAFAECCNPLTFGENLY